MKDERAPRIFPPGDASFSSFVRLVRAGEKGVFSQENVERIAEIWWGTQSCGTGLRRADSLLTGKRTGKPRISCSKGRFSVDEKLDLSMACRRNSLLRRTGNNSAATGNKSWAEREDQASVSAPRLSAGTSSRITALNWGVTEGPVIQMTAEWRRRSERPAREGNQ